MQRAIEVLWEKNIILNFPYFFHSFFFLFHYQTYLTQVLKNYIFVFIVRKCKDKYKKVKM